ncbi:hypothetical protein S245_058534, partial [Arachis hypogaea]
KLLLLLLLQRLRVETREEVIVTERGREQISRASFSPTIEKTRHPPSESRASSSSPPPPSPPPRPPPRHPVHHLWLVLRYAILNLEVIQAAISLAGFEVFLFLWIWPVLSFLKKASVLIALAMAAGTGGVVAGELELNHECSLMHWSPEDFESKLQIYAIGVGVEGNCTARLLAGCILFYYRYIKFRLRKGNTGLISSDLVVASPVEDYFLYIDDQKNPEK